MSDSANLTPDNDATQGVDLLDEIDRYIALISAPDERGCSDSYLRSLLGSVRTALREKAARDAAPADPCWCGVARDGHSAKQQRICDSERPPVAAPADLRALKPGDLCRVDAEISELPDEYGAIEVNVYGEPNMVTVSVPISAVHATQTMTLSMLTEREALLPDRRHPAVPPAQPASQADDRAKCWNCGGTKNLVACCHLCAVVAKTQDAALHPTPAASSGLAAELRGLLKEWDAALASPESSMPEYHRIAEFVIQERANVQAALALAEAVANPDDAMVERVREALVNAGFSYLHLASHKAAVEGGITAVLKSLSEGQQR